MHYYLAGVQGWVIDARVVLRLFPILLFLAP